jgi:hypothetical protein
LPEQIRSAPELITLPREIRKIASNVVAAMEGSSAYLRRKGLENCRRDLADLQRQLPAFVVPQAQPRWWAMLHRWQEVIDTESERQRDQGFDEIIQPFQAGNPLRLDRQDIFRGRQRFADDLSRAVFERGRPTLVLHGPRRCGKTSFLLHLPRLLPSDLLPVYIDLQGNGATGSEVDFCATIARNLAGALRSQNLAVRKVARDAFLRNPYAMLEDWLDEVQDLLGGRRLLVCLDEWEKLAEATLRGTLSESLFNQIRHMIQHRDELAFLICGVQTLDELGPSWSSYFISVRPFEMLYLERDEAEHLITRPVPEFKLQYDDAVVTRILDMTRCQPCLLQLIGETMVTQANLERANRITHSCWMK